jgi:hypothetical protein
MAEPVRTILKRILRLFKTLISLFLMFILYMPFVVIQHILLAIIRMFRDLVVALDETIFTDVK